MYVTLLLAFLAAAQGQSEIIVGNDPSQGAMPGENRTLSQWHRNMDDRMFPDLAVKDMRMDGDTLHVLVTNQGGYRAEGPILVTANAVANGISGEAAPERLGSLSAGKSRWVALRQFSLKAASSNRGGPVFALDGAYAVTATVRQSAAPAPALNRSGQSCDQCREVNEANNSLSAEGAALDVGGRSNRRQPR